MTAEKVYLGDAVYAQRLPHGDVVLTTEDGIACSNIIILEPQVLAALVAWATKEAAPRLISVAAQTDDEPRPRCTGSCGHEIDPDCCCCGIPKADHSAFGDGHEFTPMGCRCNASDDDAPSTADAQTAALVEIIDAVRAVEAARLVTHVAVLRDCFDTTDVDAQEALDRIEVTSGRCRYCGCTDRKACPGGCAWSDGAKTVCTACMEHL